MIHISDPHHAERRRVEAFVEDVYARSFGGRITSHYPTLMSVQDADGRIYAVAGFRYAHEAPLFLEQYLDAPVEDGIAAVAGEKPARAKVAEIGNLASDGRGATVFLFLELAHQLWSTGCEYAVATATRQLRGIFQKAGFSTTELAPAVPTRLPDGGREWGRYYDAEPVVLAGSINRACPPLEAFAAAAAQPRPLRSRLHFASGKPAA